MRRIRGERPSLSGRKCSYTFRFTLSLIHIWVVNYTDGYIVDIPADWKQDFTLSPIRVRYTGENTLLTITTEDVKKPTAEEHLKEYVNLYLLDKNWQKKNRVTELQPTETKTYGEFTAQILSLIHI